MLLGQSPRRPLPSLAPDSQPHRAHLHGRSVPSRGAVSPGSVAVTAPEIKARGGGGPGAARARLRSARPAVCGADGQPCAPQAANSRARTRSCLLSAPPLPGRAGGPSTVDIRRTQTVPRRVPQPCSQSCIESELEHAHSLISLLPPFPPLSVRTRKSSAV